MGCLGEVRQNACVKASGGRVCRASRNPGVKAQVTHMPSQTGQGKAEIRLFPLPL